MVQIDQKHNYSKESREAVYTFFNARLLGGKGPVKEQRYRVEQLQDLLVLFEKNRPSDAVTMDRYINDRIADARKGIDRLSPRDRDSLAKSRATFHERLTFALLDVKPAPDQVTVEKTSASPHRESLLLGRAGKGDRIPAIWLTPETANPGATPTLIVHPEGINWAVISSQSGLVKDILDRGGSVLAIDAFQTGSAKAPRERTRRAFTVFNQTDDANRVQDILTALSYLQSRSNAGQVNLVGLEIAGIWTYFARALAGDGVNLAADMTQFRTDTDQEYLERFYVPGLRKAGDCKAAAVLNTGNKLLLYNVGREFPASWVTQSSRLASTVAAMHTARIDDAELAAWVASK